MLCSAQKTGRTGAYGAAKQGHFLWTARHFKTFLFLNPWLNEQLTHRPRWAAFSFCINHVSRATPCQYYQWDNSTLQSAVSSILYPNEIRRACQHPNHPVYQLCTQFSLAASAYCLYARAGEAPEVWEMGSATRKPDHSQQGSGTVSVQSQKASFEDACTKDKLIVKQAQLSGPQPQASNSVHKLQFSLEASLFWHFARRK